MSVIQRLQSPLPPPKPNRRDPFALLRHNFPLKMISVIVSVLLYFFVQSERNPSLTKALVAQIVIENLPPNTDVKNQDQVMVSVTGTRGAVERLKDNDIRAVADLSSIKANNEDGQLVRVNFKAVNVPPGTVLTFEPPNRMVKMQIFQPESRLMAVEANFPQEPAAGFEYSKPEVKPSRIKVRGMPDAVRKVTNLIVIATPIEPGGTIEGMFPVLARDAKDKPVEGITLEPSMVKVTVVLVARPPMKIVPISPNIIDLPSLPYRLEHVRVMPNQVRITGRPERLNQIGTLETEEVSVRDMTETRTIEVGLQKPVDAAVQDMDGKPISKVRVQFVIRRSNITAPPPITVPPNKDVRDNGAGNINP